MSISWKIALAIWFVAFVVMSVEFFGALFERYKQSKMSDSELITYLMEKHGRDWQDHIIT